MTLKTLKAGSVDVPLRGSLKRTDAIRRAAPALEGLDALDRRIEVLKGYIGSDPDNALRLIDHVLSTRI